MPYRPTHRAPDDGMQAWDTPDGTKPPVAALDARLDVEVVERQGAWARILCSNGWSAWVDGRRLVEMSAAAAAPTPAPTPAPAPAPTPAPAAAWSSPPASSPAAPTAPTPAAPAGAWTVPSGPSPATQAPAGDRRAPSLTPTQIVAALGGVAVVVSAWLNWLGSVEEIPSASAYDAPAKFLIDSDADLGGPSLGILVLLVGAVAIAGAFVRSARILSIVGGAAAVLIVIVFTFQLNNRISDLNDDFDLDFSLTDFLDFGEYLAVAGGVAAIVGGILALRTKS